MKYFNILNQLEGWCTLEKCTKLYDLIIKTKPTHLVEIGVFGGRSLLSQAFALKDNNHGTIYGVDSWCVTDCVNGMTQPEAITWWKGLNYEQIYNSCINAINANQLNEHILLKRMTSEQYIHLIDYEIDILHIDGNHEEENSCRDVELYLPKVKSGGYIWFDDANWYQTKKAVDLIENKFACKLIDKAAADDKNNNYCNLYIKV